MFRSSLHAKMGPGERIPLIPPSRAVSTAQFIKIISPFLLLQISVGLCSSLQVNLLPVDQITNRLQSSMSAFLTN